MKASQIAYAKRLKNLLERRVADYNRQFVPKEATILEDYKIPAVHYLPPKPHSIQLDETNGRLPFDEDNYHCEEYNNLMKNITGVREKYSLATGIEERKSFATEEINHWHNYMSEREKSLPEHCEINPTSLSLLEECFNRESERRNKTMRSDRIVEFHYKYARKRPFDIFIDHQHMLQILHPFQGYMSAIDDRFFTFDEIIKMYRQQIVASYEKSIGQTYLASKFLNLIVIDELSCLAFWDIIDKERKGYVDFNNFVRVLKMFRFHLPQWTLNNIRHEFQFLLDDNKSEILENAGEDNFIGRFNLTRLIFLERGL
jgi:hypothetical protein